MRRGRGSASARMFRAYRSHHRASTHTLKPRPGKRSSARGVTSTACSAISCGWMKLRICREMKQVLLNMLVCVGARPTWFLSSFERRSLLVSAALDCARETAVRRALVQSRAPCRLVGGQFSARRRCVYVFARTRRRRRSVVESTPRTAKQSECTTTAERDHWEQNRTSQENGVDDQVDPGGRRRRGRGAHRGGVSTG
jgi:hypothetical protein